MSAAAAVTAQAVAAVRFPCPRARAVRGLGDCLDTYIAVNFQNLNGPNPNRRSTSANLFSGKS